MLFTARPCRPYGLTAQVESGGACDQTEGTKAVAWHESAIYHPPESRLDVQLDPPHRGGGPHRGQTFEYPRPAVAGRASYTCHPR